MLIFEIPAPGLAKTKVEPILNLGNERSPVTSKYVTIPVEEVDSTSRARFNDSVWIPTRKNLSSILVDDVDTPDKDILSKLDNPWGAVAKPIKPIWLVDGKNSTFDTVDFAILILLILCPAIWDTTAFASYPPVSWLSNITLSFTW